ncbi:sigma-70 family RNA polymerase sigma factor [Flammeovirga kamogawensis]|uniref:Uncharacterized protein n=1 Tax=Flammeovirga kamogawensis TaxID=373891 RepID=A0ABX8H1Z6_9BACT|nr:hypothetical protein [Flammeovirga kamogawensis]MBB6462267.1 putative transcriptional regulator [Flammeovirga kamogawensis]QWG09337.1 hypothetical protein KM029_22285 [Flammeovirga kamogawensis]TRX64859.1 hypothetical protein EO216_20195 [Flammeovirga kamogawensis]
MSTLTLPSRESSLNSLRHSIQFTSKIEKVITALELETIADLIDCTKYKNSFNRGIQSEFHSFQLTIRDLIEEKIPKNLSRDSLITALDLFLEPCTKRERIIKAHELKKIEELLNCNAYLSIKGVKDQYQDEFYALQTSLRAYFGEEPLSDPTIVEMPEEIKDISLNDVKEFDDRNFIDALIKNNITTIGEMGGTSEREFKNIKSLGVGKFKKLTALKDKAIQEQELLLHIYHKNTKVFVIGEQTFDFDREQTLYEIIQIVINDFLNYVTERDNEILSYYYGVGRAKGKSYMLKDIGVVLGITGERVRQEKVKLFKELFIPLLEGKTIATKAGYQIRCDEEIVNYIQQYKEQVESDSILTLKTLIEIFGEVSNIELIEDIFNIQEVKGFTAKTSTRFFIKNEEDKNVYKKLITTIYKLIDNHTLSISETDLLFEIKSKYPKISREAILNVTQSIQEVERIMNEEEVRYQIYFNNITNINEAIARILFEKGEKMDANQIYIEYNKRKLLEGNKEMDYDKFRLRMPGSPLVKAHGKRGIFSLKEWGLESKPIKDLILDTFKEEGNYRPLSVKEIKAYVKTRNNSLSELSINTCIGIYLVKLKSGNYITETMKPSYIKEVIMVGEHKKRDLENTIRQQFKDVITKNGGSYPCRQLKAKLKEIGMAAPTIHNYLSNRLHFGVIEKEGEEYYTAIQSEEEKQRTTILSSIKNYLEGRKTPVPKKEIVTALHTKFNYSKTTVGIYLSGQRTSELVKKKIDGKAHYLLPEYTEEYEQKIFQNEVIDLLKEKGLNPNSNVFNNMHKFLEHSTGINDIEGLHERIYPNIYNFIMKYREEGEHKVHRINIITQLATCMEPFTRKILYVSNPYKSSEYERLEPRNQGLGTLFYELGLYHHSHPLKPLFHRANDNRNLESHTAQQMTSEEIENLFTLFIFLYFYLVHQNRISIDRLS